MIRTAFVDAIAIDLDGLSSRRRFLRQAAGLSAGVLAFVRRPEPAWGDEPPAARLRDGKVLKVHTADPLNAEPALGPLAESWLTPVERFFVRTHGSTPGVDVKSFRLTVEGLVDKPLSLSFDELRAFDRASLTATITCAGNRREEHSKTKKVRGVQWGAGAIGNARWDGVRLADVLKKAGLKEGAKHIWFESLDSVNETEGAPFGASIPLEKALSGSETSPGPILADSMHEKPLPIDHGFPLRGVVPGFIGARSVKWLGKLVVSDRPSPNHFVKDVYKIVSTTGLEEAHQKTPIYEFPINAAIAEPGDGAAVKGATVDVVGYALPRGEAGRTIARVDVSADGGRNWTEARLSSPAREYCWQLWKANLPLPAGTSTLVVRATDSAGKSQPDKIEWNAKGYLYNAWHRVDVTRG